MLFQYIFRNIKKRPFLNFIKVLGLALGLSGVLFISLFLKNELTYDSFHNKADRIYRLTYTNPGIFGNNHFARIYNSEQVPDLAAHFPEIENYARLAPLRGGVMMHNERYYSINEAFVCDSSFFRVFDTELLVGNKHTVLEAPGSMVVSEAFAQKVFGDESAVGKIISLPAGQFYARQTDFTVKGVMENFPQNSHFHPDLIATPAQDEISWWAYTYLLLKEHANPENITAGYSQFTALKAEEFGGESETKAYLQPITDIHLHSDKLREIEANSNMTNIYVLSVAAFILLLISMSNYASLNLGMAGFNNKFVTINRILGSTRNMNLKYFFAESLFIVLVSTLVALAIGVLVNSLIAHHFGIHLFRGNSSFIALVVSFFGLLGILSGLQPVLKQRVGQIQQGKQSLIKSNKIKVSQGIIISQYIFAIGLIVAVIIISRQNRFVLENSLGAGHKNIICFESVHANVQQKFEIFKSELLKHSSIESVSAMLEPPGGEANDMFPFEMEGYSKAEKERPNMIGVFPCDYSFAELFNLDFLSGNNFSQNNSDTEGSGEFLINETAMQFLNYNNPQEIIGKEFRLISPNPEVTVPQGKIVGVVKDFHLSSLKKRVEPLVLFKRDKLWLLNFVVSFKPGMRQTALSDISSLWQELFPAYPFIYEDVDVLYKKVYKTELLQARLLSIFTFISIFISSMGLLGISLLVSQQQTKEIGIRKVNGAKVSEILAMLNKDFIKWVVIAFVIATPIAYYAMNKWLENFAYKTTLSWWVFALSGMLALGIALLTVSWQSWRAATRNPVEALRYE
ncbi:putative ABC transport system permease protein [Mariniphaga anaerophila]|uniref:Putative ABC transport system permease protein n=1 Tax=Mariniphaga anaerophila TaxID=1484053 RepID=A0A1M5FPI5_9BACT|nr:ABC transporter permease [Mariniphaga anaerophila]SHF93413.1 putative ABC transport system permease protein [Mariniphaga anaerophila]